MKNSKFKNILLPVLLVLIVFVTFVFAGPAEDRDDHRLAGVHTFEGLTNLVFEGAIYDGTNKTTFTVTEPTAARTITIPDGDVTLGNTDAHTTLTTVTVADATTNLVADLLTLSHTGGTIAASGFGTGLAFDLEDATAGGAAEEHGRINVVMTDRTSTTEESDMTFSVMSNGDVNEVGRFVTASGSATAGDHLLLTTDSAETNGAIDSIIIKANGGTIVDNFGTGISIWLENEDADVEEKLTIQAVQTDTTNGTEDTDFVLTQFTGTAAAMAETLRSVAANTVTTGDYLQFTSNTTDDNAIHTVLLLTQANGASTATTGNGIAISFQPEDAGGAEEQASIGVVFTDATNATEDTDMVFSVQDAGGVVEHTRLESDGGIYLEGATADGIQLILLPGDPAASDKTISLPATTTSAMMISALTTNDVDVANSIWGVSNGLAFGGTTGANTFEVTVSPGADPGADVALTLPTASGAIPTVIGASSVKTIETITATDIQALADCGKTLILTHATVPIIVTLPAIAGSSGCEFWIRHGLATNQDHTVVTESSDNIIMGSTVDNNTPPGSYQAAGDLVTFVNSVESVGDYIHVISNGVNWFLDGVAELNGGITQGST